MSTWPAWLGDLPTWFASIAVVFAACHYSAERRRHRADSERETRAQASHLAAWAVTDADKPRRYGVRVVNTSGSPFYDVEVDALLHGKTVPSPHRLNVLPPGDYFIELVGSDGRFSWTFACRTDEHPGTLRPYMQSPRYRVTGVRFTDGAGLRWVLEDGARLSLGRGGPRAGRAGAGGPTRPS